MSNEAGKDFLRQRPDSFSRQTALCPVLNAIMDGKRSINFPKLSAPCSYALSAKVNMWFFQAFTALSLISMLSIESTIGSKNQTIHLGPQADGGDCITDIDTTLGLTSSLAVTSARPRVSLPLPLGQLPKIAIVGKLTPSNGMLVQ